MYRIDSRAIRGTLGAMLMALVGCADEPTSPTLFQELDPQFAPGDVIMVTNLSGSKVVGSLSWALGQVTGGEVIRFAPGLAGQTITLDTTIVVRSKPFILEGPASGGITISGGGKVRVFDLDPGAAGNETVLRNLTIADGAAPDGAGIMSRGSTAAWVRVENSTITRNVAIAAPAILGSSIYLINSTVTGNTATSMNEVPAVNSRNLTLVNSAIAYNTSAGFANGRLILRNSIIANHTRRNCMQSSTLNTFEGGNISDDDTCGSVFDLTIADPMLGPLSDNGGPTMTRALLVGSPAINGGSACSVAVDQRYAPRDAECDIGPYEFIDFTTVELAVAASATFDRDGWAVLSGTVRCSRNETFDLHITLQQMQKSGRDMIDIHSVTTTPISCTTGVLPWSVALVTTDGPFQNGDAAATVAVLNAAKWVTPTELTQPVKLFKSRK